MTDASDLVTALEKLPPYSGVTWRGATGSLAGSLRLPAPLPTTRDPRIATSNFTSPVAWAIVAAAGRDIAPLSADPSTQEVALLPGSALTPAGVVHEIDGLLVQVVLEVREGAPVGAVPDDAELANLLSAARALGSIVVSQPGRFG